MTVAAPPLISILLPAFNAEATLPACLRSVGRQSQTRWECLVVDDGSTDDTAQIVAAFASRDERFRLLSDEHRGLVGALNFGAASSRGRYIARMDADDLMHRDRLGEQLELLERDGGLDAVGCHVRSFPRRSLGRGALAYERWLNAISTESLVHREAFIECPVAHPTLMIRRDRLVEFGYRDRGWPEDYDLILRLLEADRRIGMLDRRRLCWREHPTRLSRTSAKYSIEQFTACKAEFISRSYLRRHERYILWGYGATGRTLRKALAARDRHPSHIVEVHPRRVGNRIHDALVIPPAELSELRGEPLIVSVSGQGPRNEIRLALREMGLVETRDFICAA